ncbi:hypothetical protein FOL47_009567 [Perkinsus chesapeaki]|uniref:SCP domain-containing protein n=1 Tax=Perkinsus chesapeaki TaxID=330153 RepID=A0A7J6L7D8_PERCH|nr:hypothetical protein FOL47_009567 [Perkinsus chesapeaki]
MVPIISIFILTAALTEADFGKSWLNTINYFRCLHDAPPLAEDSELKQLATHWAQTMRSKSLGGDSHSDLQRISPRVRTELVVSYKGEGSPICAPGESSNFNEDCATLSWYMQYDESWKGVGSWKGRMPNITNFFTLVFKPYDRVGCAKIDDNYVCQFGSSRCLRIDSSTENGQPDEACLATDPPSMSTWWEGNCEDEVKCVAARNEDKYKNDRCGKSPGDLDAPYSAGKGWYKTVAKVADSSGSPSAGSFAVGIITAAAMLMLY